MIWLVLEFFWNWNRKPLGVRRTGRDWQAGGPAWLKHATAPAPGDLTRGFSRLKCHCIARFRWWKTGMPVFQNDHATSQCSKFCVAWVWCYASLFFVCVCDVSSCGEACQIVNVPDFTFVSSPPTRYPEDACGVPFCVVHHVALLTS